MRALVVVGTSRADLGDVEELLRVLGALRACGHEVRLVETGAGVGALASSALRPDAERLLDALSEDGVVPAPDADVAGEVAGADALIVLGDPDRAGVPAVLSLARGRRPSGEAMRSLLEAGRVVLE